MYFLLRSGSRARFIEEISAQDKSVAESIEFILYEL